MEYSTVVRTYSVLVGKNEPLYNLFKLEVQITEGFQYPRKLLKIKGIIEAQSTNI
jgi:hypothetical protein